MLLQLVVLFCTGYILAQDDSVSLDLGSIEADLTKLETQLNVWLGVGEDHLFKVVTLERRLGDIRETGCSRFWQYSCGGQCMAYYLLCDGQSDCPDGEDETPQFCRRTLPEGNRPCFTAVAEWRTNIESSYRAKPITFYSNDARYTILDYFPSVPEVAIYSHTVLGPTSNLVVFSGIYNYAIGAAFVGNTGFTGGFFRMGAGSSEAEAIAIKGFPHTVPIDQTHRPGQETSTFYCPSL